MDNNTIQAVVIIVVAAIVMIGIVAVLAPAALSIIIKPLLEVLASAIEALNQKNQPPPL